MCAGGTVCPLNGCTAMSLAALISLYAANTVDGGQMLIHQAGAEQAFGA